MLDNLKPFGAPACESDLQILGEDKYSRYYLDSTYFAKQSLDSSVYLIVGRRGSGKTALAKFFSFQHSLSRSIEIYIDEPASFHEVMSKIAEQESFNEDLQIPRLVKTWEYVVWYAIFHELENRDPRIKAACTFEAGGTGASKLIRHLLQALIEKYIGAKSLSDEIEKIVQSASFCSAQKAVFEIAKRNPIIIAIDTLEKYKLQDPRLMTTTAALVEFSSKFSRKYSPRNIYIKAFMMDEIFPYLREEYISNTLKYVRDEIYLHWKPKDLMRMICWRLFQYLKINHLPRRSTADVDWDNHKDVWEKIWKPFFGEYLKNGNNIEEETFPYILRHTQLRPRQVIVLCNSIAKEYEGSGKILDFLPRDIVIGANPIFSSENIVRGIKRVEDSLADEVFSTYSSAYPNAARIADALSGMPPIFEAKELEKRAHRTASEWAEDYSPYRFCQFVAELGIVGRLREKCSHFREESTGTEIFEADFEYALKGRLVLADEVCAIHPMFYKKLNIKFNRISSTLRKKLCLPEGVTPCIYPSIPRS